MKLFKITIAAVLLILETGSCDPEISQSMISVTGAATHISCRNAEIAGKAALPKTTSTDLTFGILYSTSSGVLIGTSTQIEAHIFDSEYNYSVNTEVLEPETTYYYRAYTSQSGEITYGDVKSFKTLTVGSMIRTLDATDINPKDAVLNASLDLTDCKYDVLEYGFEVKPEGRTVHTVKSDNHSEKKFSAKIESLSKDTNYSIVAYAKLDGRIYKGEAKDFTATSVQAFVTAESSDETYHSATISGELAIESEGTFTKSATLYYSSAVNTLEALKSNGTKRALTLGADGTYSIRLSSLVSGTQYNYVVVSKVDEIEFITDVKSFDTFPITAFVTAESSDVKHNKATISGKLIVESEGLFTKSAMLFYSSIASTLEDLKSSGMKRTMSLDSDGEFSLLLETLACETKYYCVVVSTVDDVKFNSSVISFTTTAIPLEAVDLGLSVCWATCNLGASKPEDYGGYYQWAGDMDASSTSIYLDWDNCPYHTGSSSSSDWTKYIPSGYSSYWSGSGNPDNKIVLDSEDDVAHVALSGRWRMPTDAEWTELRKNCTWTWTTHNGVKGYKVTSKKSGYTNKSIFLPAAGLRKYDNIEDPGSRGLYWSSSLNTDNPFYAYCVDFSSDNVGRHNGSRCFGRSVRPVSE